MKWAHLTMNEVPGSCQHGGSGELPSSAKGKNPLGQLIYYISILL
jgi:hypothetical protein